METRVIGLVAESPKPKTKKEVKPSNDRTETEDIPPKSDRDKS